MVRQCRRCRRYERPPDSSGSGRFEPYEPESPELLSLCLRHIPALQANKSGEQYAQMTGVSKINVADAMWVWTEPHSMRLKVRLTVRAEVGGGAGGSLGGVTVQQRVLVELRVGFGQCPECNREFTNRTWHAIVQLRQKRANGDPRKGLMLLEAALAKNADVRQHVLSVDTARHGFDFYFLSLVHAKTFSSFLAKVCPMRIKTTQKLVSADSKSNTANLKHTVSCDLVPLCRDDLIIVDKRAAHSGGGAGTLSGRLCLVDKVSSAIRLINASPTRSSDAEMNFAELPAEKYWRGGEDRSFRLIFSSRRLVRFVVLDIELCQTNAERKYSDDKHELYKGPNSGVEKYALADVEVARETDFGHTDQTYHCVTHLGNLIHMGDVVLGYDLVNSVLPSDAEWSIENALNSNFVVPDVVLVKKVKGGGSEETKKNEGVKDEVKDPKDNGENPVKSKSKRRERQRKKDDKKIKKLKEAAARMGLLNDIEGPDTGAEEMDGNSSLEHDRSEFQRELENDLELARELEFAEHELAKAGQDINQEAGTTEETAEWKSSERNQQIQAANSAQKDEEK